MTRQVRIYKKQRQLDGRLREQLILDYSPVVSLVAKRILAKLPPGIELDDLISAGHIGLMDAISRYDPTMNNTLKTYAEHRIRGAILDELRATDWVPRSIRDKAKQFDDTIRNLQKELGRSPEASEIAARMSLPLRDWHRIRALLNPAIGPMEPQRISEIRVNAEPGNPEDAITRAGDRALLVRAIEKLSDRQRQVLALYYYEGLNLKEIGGLLGVTESRVSQIHGAALRGLRRILDGKSD